MLRHRKILLAVILLAGGGSFYGTLGYALYVHGDGYRIQRERQLANFLELPVRIGDIRPQSYYQADFLDIHAWLPDRRAEIFHCDRAEWHTLPGHDGAFHLTIRNGRLTIDDDEWREDDYRRVLRSGLGHDFAAIKLRWVDLFEMDMSWRKGPISFTVQDANGRVGFDEADAIGPTGEGRISLTSHVLNDTHTDEHISVVARFRPSRDLVVHEVVLGVPELPVSALRLESLLGVPMARGTFEGRLVYREQNGGPHVELQGQAAGIELVDWTQQLHSGPIRGRVDMKIDRAVVTDQALLGAKFSGKATDVQLADVARLVGAAPLEGSADMEVLHAEFDAQGLVRMSLRGKIVSGSLDPITALLGEGKITGRLELTVNALDLAGEQLVSADIDVQVVPPEGKPGRLDSQLILDASRMLMGIELSPLLTEPLKRINSVAYTRLACKLIVDDGQLRVLGTHGPGGLAILTVRLFGTDLAVLVQPKHPIELAPLIAMIRAGGEQKVRELIERYQPTTAPVGLR